MLVKVKTGTNRTHSFFGKIFVKFRSSFYGNLPKFRANVTLVRDHSQGHRLCSVDEWDISFILLKENKTRVPLWAGKFHAGTDQLTTIQFITGFGTINVAVTTLLQRNAGTVFAVEFAVRAFGPIFTFRLNPGIRKLMTVLVLNCW